MSNLYHDDGPPANGRKVLLATTCYDRPAPGYVFSIARSREALSAAGIQTGYMLLVGNCHVDDARNAVVREFLETDCTHLMFLDADVVWEPDAIVQLCKRDLDIVGGVYPFRRDGGENMPVRLMDHRRPVDGLIEIEGLPTGFMLIARHVLETMAAEAPWYWDKVYKTAMVFDRPDPDQNGTRWGGDIAFCNRWRARGGKLFADVELRLGHVGDVTLSDSLGAFLRRQTGETFAHIMPRFRDGVETEADYNELFKAYGNPYAADAPTLALLVGVARKCRGPIIETGSGLSSVLMAAVSDGPVYCLEHEAHWAARTKALAEEAGTRNVGICQAPMVDLWYQTEPFYLPAKFALGFCDGPPRNYGTRMRFFDVFGDRCEAIIVDDAKSDTRYLGQLQAWADANGRTLQLLGRAALITKPQHWTA